MTSEIKTFLKMLIAEAHEREEKLTFKAWGKERTFVAFDLFDDTFIFEDGIWDNLENKDSVILVPKSAFSPPNPEGKKRRTFGNIMTVSSGNHAVTSIPLLMGQFWDIPGVPEEQRSDTLVKRLVCANVVGNTIEISQRDVATPDVVEMDDWLQALGCPMRSVVLIDRIDSTLQYYNKRGQEWRIKPLAWTFSEMNAAIRSSISHMHSCIKYYHNVKGVHFLTYKNFCTWGEQIEENYSEFLSGLTELAGTSELTQVPNLLLSKYRTHHEVELFGLPDGVAERIIIPELIELYKEVNEEKYQPHDVRERFNAIESTFRASLLEPGLLEEDSPDFIQNLYRNITGQVYFDETYGLVSSAFDDMRTALPGATYMLGNRFIHDGADARTIAILDVLEREISHGDRIEHVNIYEIRSITEKTHLGEGKSREIVFKTMWNPKDTRIIEKRLAHSSTGYGAYTLARVSAFRSLGISYGRHRLIARNDGAAGDIHYFTRARYPGIPFNKIPKMLFCNRDLNTGKYDLSKESADIVRALIRLLGGSAAEAMILKKYRKGQENHYCDSKEIIEFGYDVRYGKEMPIGLHLCSIRGTMGWEDTSLTEDNLLKMFDFFMSEFVKTVKKYADDHPILSRYDIADAFFEGFSAKTREVNWKYMNRREQFDTYSPRVYGDYRFAEKWEFVLWSLQEQRKRLDYLYDLFNEKLAREYPEELEG